MGLKKKDKPSDIQARIIAAEIEQAALKASKAMKARKLFKVPIPAPRSAKARPKPGEQWQRDRRARASELAAATKRKGPNSILKQANKYEQPGHYTTGRYIKVSNPGLNWIHWDAEKAVLKRDGQGCWTSEIESQPDTEIETVEQFSHPITFGVDSLERLDKEQESRRMEDKLERSIEAAEQEQERLKQEIERRDGMTKPKVKTAPMPEWAGVALMNAIYEGSKMAIKDQLPRDQYDQLKKIVEALGGKRDRRAKIDTEQTEITGAHVFKGDARGIVLDAVGKAINEAKGVPGKVAGIVDTKKTFGQFFTPRAVAEIVFDLAEIDEGMRILEPSAGNGALLQPIFEQFGDLVEIVAVEKDPKLVKELEDSEAVSAFDVALDSYCCDFLEEFEDEEGYDRIVMNPPFDHGLDIEHVLHAVNFLNPKGKLVAVVANGTRQNE